MCISHGSSREAEPLWGCVRACVCVRARVCEIYNIYNLQEFDIRKVAVRASKAVWVTLLSLPKSRSLRSAGWTEATENEYIVENKPEPQATN